jgi:hypothetical protein
LEFDEGRETICLHTKRGLESLLEREDKFNKKFRVLLDCVKHLIFMNDLYTLHYKCLICSIVRNENNKKLTSKDSIYSRTE